MINKYIVKIIAVMLLALPAVYPQSKVGTTAANFLTIPVGPRASAMGGAFTAISEDVTAAYWNAGGLARLSKSEFSVSHTGWLAGTHINWLGLAYKLDENNAIAVSVNQLDYGEEEITTAEEPNGTGQMWDAMDIAIGVSYARNLTERFSIGGTIKYIQQRIWNESATAFAVDVGLLFRSQFHDLMIGMNITNFGSEIKYEGKDLYQPVDVDPSNTGNNENIVASLNTSSWMLPLIFSVGTSMQPVNTNDWKWIVAADAVYPNNQSPYLNTGTELSWLNLISLRAGYNSLFKKDAEEGLCAGLGLQYSFGSYGVKVDYSYNDFGIFDDISRYSVTITF
jgi:hypothetical protein